MAKHEPIKRRKLSHEVIDRLLDMIQTGELSTGDHLPSEHDLMARYGVGRPAVREALQALENMGLISIQHGERARVKEVTAEDLFTQIQSTAQHLLSTSPENIRHLMEARQVFESGVTYLAAKRRSDNSIKKLEKWLIQMRESINDRPNFIKADQAFHTTIAEISGNPIFPALSRAMFQWLSIHEAGFAQNILGIPYSVELTLKEHEEILNLIARQDAEGAAKKISEHIIRVNELFDPTTNSH